MGVGIGVGTSVGMLTVKSDDLNTHSNCRWFKCSTAIRACSMSARAELSIALGKPRERVLDSVSLRCVCAVVWFVIFIPDPSVDFFLYTASILL